MRQPRLIVAFPERRDWGKKTSILAICFGMRSCSLVACVIELSSRYLALPYPIPCRCISDCSKCPWVVQYNRRPRSIVSIVHRQRPYRTVFRLLGDTACQIRLFEYRVDDILEQDCNEGSSKDQTGSRGCWLGFLVFWACRQLCIFERETEGHSVPILSIRSLQWHT